MELNKSCPKCKSQEIKEHSCYETKNNGTRKLYECSCKTFFSETKNTFLEGLRKPVSLIVMVVKARAEGMAFNAACRTFEISKNTLILWQSRLANIKKILFLFALAHEFLKLLIEGDELYRSVKKNVPPEDSRGWTIVLMSGKSFYMVHGSAARKTRNCLRRQLELFVKL